MRKYLENYQQVAFSTLLNCKNNNRLPQAILLNGHNDTPLIEIAKFFAKTIVLSSASIFIG